MKDHASQNIPLNFQEAYELGVYSIQGCLGDQLAQIQTIAALSALHNIATYNYKKIEDLYLAHSDCLPDNAAEQIAGLCAAVFEHDIQQSEFGYINPNVLYAMDNCGMGGDLTVTANVSTLAALIAATAGIPMLKHGSPANADKGRHGSSDFIKLLGLETYMSKERIEEMVEQDNFSYCEALDVRFKRIHMQTHSIAQLPHMNDIIGPITNPLNPQLLTRRVVGLNHLVSPEVIARAYQILNEKGVTRLEHGLFVRGYLSSNSYVGVDEVSICEGGTKVVELKNGRISSFDLHARDFGIEEVSPESISPPAGMSKGEFSLGILEGKIGGAPLQMVLANAALLFYLAKMSHSFKDCYALAKQIFESGQVYQKAVQLAGRELTITA